MNRLKRVLLQAFAWFGGLWIARHIANNFEVTKDVDGRPAFPFLKRRDAKSMQILVYHRVNDENDHVFPAVPTKVFADQMEYVAEHYSVCSLGEAVERLRSGNVPDRLLSITFDDGYRDNYTHAFPIVSRLNLPTTIFLATDAIDSGRILWHDRVFSVFRCTQAKALESNFNNGQTYSLSTPSEKRRALMEVLKFLWSLNEADRSLWIERLGRELGVRETVSCDGLMLSWGDIKVMSEHGVDFGAHSVTHPILSRLSVDQLKREIRESKDTIETNLERPVKHFAYPVGRREDFTDAVKKELRDTGFECAVTTIFGSNDSKQDLFELRRASPWDQDIDVFALRLSYFKFASC